MQTTTLAALALAFTLGPAAAESYVSAYTDTALKTCKITVPGAPGVGEPDSSPVYRCKGLDGRAVFITEGDLRTAIAYGSPTAKEPSTTWHSFYKFSDVGLKMEWRGPQVRGSLVPVATILRYHWSVDGKKGSILAVTRLGRGDEDTCVFVYVDAVANPDANAIAARVADEEAAAHTCGIEGDPRWVGKVSEDLR